MSLNEKISEKKGIALVAHDNKKIDLINWISKHKKKLAQHKLYGTGTTGKLINNHTGLEIEKLNSGPLGGDQQIGAMIATGDIDMVFFFFDPMEAQPHDSDVKALLRLCVLWNIPMACDRATADFVITSPFMHGDYDATIPDYSGYLNRKIVK